jgi:pimeloyl-ACP methyl ester carboxylesterase
MKYAVGISLALLLLALVPGFTPGIKHSGRGAASVAELRKVTLGDSEQWVLIRSEDTANPIILFVHGGPGTSQLTLMRKGTQPLEKYFTVVNWDQRGAGKSFAAIRDRSRMNMPQFVSDINELAEYLRGRFHQDKILLAGHSWGSVIGLLAVAQRPDLYSGYIGIGQMSNMADSEKLSYDWTLQQATLAQDAKAVATLREIGPPPYEGAWQSKFMTQRRLLGKFGGEYYGSNSGAFGVVIKHLLLSTEYSVIDRVNFFRGIFASVRLLFPELLKVDLFTQVPEVKVPVWFMLGRHDNEVPSALSAQYFERLNAPQKTLYWFERSAHLPNTEERDLFNHLLIETIRPTVMDAQQ